MDRLVPAMRVARRILAIASSALVINLANPAGAGMGWLAWVAFAPWFSSLSGLTWRGTFASGLLMGLAYIVPLHWSTFSTAIGASGIAGWTHNLTTFGFFLSFAMPFAAFGVIVAKAPASWQDSPVTWPLLQAGLLASLISLSWSPFPYTPAVTQAGYSAVTQVLAVGGEPLLLMLLFWPSALIASLWSVNSQWSKSGPPLASISTCLVALGLMGHWRVSANDHAEAAGMGIRLSSLPLQLDLPAQSGAMMLTRNRAGSDRSAYELSHGAIKQSPHCESAIWPELPLVAAQNRAVCSQGSQLAQKLGIPLIMQCYREQGDQVVLTAELFTPDGADDAGRQWHAKSSLVPFYESPLWGRGPMATGAPGTLFHIDNKYVVIPTVCYELHSRAHLRRGVMDGGQIVFHMANFTAFQRQPIDVWDQAMAQLRAVEFGVPIVRAANRGPAGWIDANGRVRSSSSRFGRHAECVEVWAPASGPTIYAYLAPIGGWLPILMTLLLSLCARRVTYSSSFVEVTGSMRKPK